ncbi:DUF2179 domain-containing protein [Aerococcaceae bacterium WGS1372]
MNWLVLAQVFIINLVYIMLNTIRTLLTMRGYQKVAPLIAIVEVTIYTLGLSMVMAYINENVIYLIVYALGFGIGIYLGMLIENRIALGYSVLQIFTNDDDHGLAEALREREYGVTIQPGYGRKGTRLILTILTPRSTENALRNTVNELSPSAFFISYDAKYIHGGFWTKRISAPKIEETFQQDQAQGFEAPEDNLTKEDYIQ